MKWDVQMIPVYEGTERHNTVVGGASLWVLAGKSDDEYKARPSTWLLATKDQQQYFLKTPATSRWTKSTYKALLDEGFYAKEPYINRDMAMKSLTATEPGPLNRGFRLGGMIQLRSEWTSEVQAAIRPGRRRCKRRWIPPRNAGNDILARFARDYAGKTLPVNRHLTQTRGGPAAAAAPSLRGAANGTCGGPISSSAGWRWRFCAAASDHLRVLLLACQPGAVLGLHAGTALGRPATPGWASTISARSWPIRTRVVGARVGDLCAGQHRACHPDVADAGRLRGPPTRRYRAYRVAIIWPYAVAAPAVGLAFQFVLNPGTGILAFLNVAMPGFGTRLRPARRR